MTNERAESTDERAASAVARSADGPSDGRAESRAARLVPDLAMALCCALAVCGGVRLVSVDPDTLLAGVAIDDALYYLVPAQHLVEGQGFSFDGIHRSSGVQPLWAIVATAIAALVRDPILGVRVLCATSGALWLVAGIVLYRALRRVHRVAALLSASLWVLTGFHGNLAFAGMENGLAGLLFALLIAGAVRLGSPARPVDGGRAAAGYLRLGALVGLFALSRTESATLAGLMGLAILLGKVRLERDAHTGLRWRPALWFALPVALLLGGWLSFSVLYFDVLTPVSGDVKLLYETEWPDLHGGYLLGLWWHFGHVFEVGTWPLWSALPAVLGRLGLVVSGEAVRVGLALALALALALGATAAGARRLRSRRTRAELAPAEPRVAAWFWGVLFLYGIAHLVLIGTLLPHFTDYGLWYFPCELMLLHVALSFALLFGLRAVRLGAAATPVLAALVAVLVIAKRDVARGRPDVDFGRQQLLATGRFLDARLPAHSRVGCLSAGIVSYVARRQTVINLDGLMNDREYLDEYLAKGRLRDYLRREDVQYFGDYAPVEQWRSGISWCGNVPLDELALVKWWRMDGGLAYCVFRLWPESTAQDWPHDPLAELQFRAEVLGEHRLIGAERLAEVGPDEMVATSIAALPSGALHHVVMAKDEYRRLGVDRGWLPHEYRIDVQFGEELRLHAVDIARPRVVRGGQLVVTTWWEVLGGFAGPEIELAVDGGAPAAIASRGWLAYGTVQQDDLPAGTVVAETRSIAVAPGEPPRAASLWLRVCRADGRPIEPTGGADPVRRGPAVLLGGVQIERR